MEDEPEPSADDRSARSAFSAFSAFLYDSLRTLYRRLEKLEEEGAADQEEDPREQRDGNER
ncbi:hypothetical protein ACFL3X_00400 [Gemmatimonadota bacterium]